MVRGSRIKSRYRRSFLPARTFLPILLVLRSKSMFIKPYFLICLLI